MLILDPSLEDMDAKAAVDRFLTTVTSRGGTVANIDHWGKRRFAYKNRPAISRPADTTNLHCSCETSPESAKHVEAGLIGGVAASTTRSRG
jgi:small subunit ribosomal protein S6